MIDLGAAQTTSLRSWLWSALHGPLFTGRRNASLSITWCYIWHWMIQISKEESKLTQKCAPDSTLLPLQPDFHLRWNWKGLFFHSNPGLSSRWGCKGFYHRLCLHSESGALFWSSQVKPIPVELAFIMKCLKHHLPKNNWEHTFKAPGHSFAAAVLPASIPALGGVQLSPEQV